MTYRSQLPSDNTELEVEQALRTAGGFPLKKQISSVVRRIADYIDTMAAYYAAAAIYEQLSRLSDAELQRRGLSRENLARAVIAASDRAESPTREGFPRT